MKYPLAIFTAAATAMAAMIRSAVGDSAPMESDPDAATPIPRITPRLVEQLAYAGANDSEIADRFLMDEAVIRREFHDVLRVARALRRMNLRGLQLDLARKLNGPMLTWLGRNELLQSLSPSQPGEAPPQYEAEAF